MKTVNLDQQALVRIYSLIFDRYGEIRLEMALANTLEEALDIGRLNLGKQGWDASTFALREHKFYDLRFDAEILKLAQKNKELEKKLNQQQEPTEVIEHKEPNQDAFIYTLKLARDQFAKTNQKKIFNNVIEKIQKTKGYISGSVKESPNSSL